jgi:hypothetical protein
MKEAITLDSKSELSAKTLDLAQADVAERLWAGAGRARIKKPMSVEVDEESSNMHLGPG